MIREIEHKALNGFTMLFVLLAALIGLSWMIVVTIGDLAEFGASGSRVGWLVALILLWGH